MRWRWVIAFLLVVSGLLIVHPVWAHASLLRSVPPANAALDQAPAKIQLWFTESLEPSESSIDILDSTGKKINTASSVIDLSDPTSMSVEPGPMPDGVYTIAWQNVSRDDGHPLSGSFAITIGQDAAGTASTSDNAADASLDPAPAAGRVLGQWFLFLFASIVIGGAGFWTFIWKPAPSAEHPTAERWLRRALWIGCAGLGAAVVFSLLEQVSQVNPAGIVDIAGLVRVFGTRFGLIWLVRLTLWIGLGISVVWWPRRTGILSLILGICFLLTITLLSHGESAQIVIPALAADWLHLTATSLWVGGLIAFAIVLVALRADPDAAALRAVLTQYFSNMARVAVAALLLTGLYATWLQVGSLDALTSTRYGQTLLLKLALIVPLLLIAAVNLLLTQRRLGDAVPCQTRTRWSGILRGLVGGEIVLTTLVLLVVGALTSSVPARTVNAIQAARATTPDVSAYTDMQMTSKSHIVLEIAPGYAGSNTFSVGLFSMATGQALNDATLVKLQFTAKDAVIGNSQLRATPQGKGEYTVTGANLSLPGAWRVRISIQRPNEYDEVIDFNVQVPPAPAAQARGPLPFQASVLIVLGLVCATGGGFFLSTSRRRRLSGEGLLTLGVLGCSLLFVGVGVLTLLSEQSQVAASGASASLANPADDLAVLEFFSRWVSSVALAILGGGIVFTPLILQPALASAARQSKRRESTPVPTSRSGGSFSENSGLFRVLVVSCITAALATMVEAVLATADSSTGLFWFRLLILAGVGVLLVFRCSRWWRRDFSQSWWWGGSLLSGLALLTVNLNSLNSPAVMTLDPLLAAAIDWIHLITLAILLGGLVALALALRWLHAAQGQSFIAMAHVAGRFFLVAALCIVVGGLVGAYRALDEIGDPANLIDTTYGVVLLIKLGLLVPLLGLMIWNLVTIPRRQGTEQREPGSWYFRTLWTVGVEAGLAVIMLLAASSLASLPLPRDVFGAGFVQHQQVGDLRVILAANPGQPGKNKVDVYLRDPIGRPIANADKVVLTLSMLDHEMGVSEAVVNNVGNGRYTAQGNYLEMVGMWRVDAVIGRVGQDDVQTEFIVPIGMTSPTPGLPVLAYPSRALFGVELIVAAIVLAVSAARLRRIREWAGSLSILFAVTIGLLGAGITSSGFAAGYMQAPAVNNPVPADAASLGRGQQVYETTCSACHGTSGRGDGPASVGLEPPPADLRVHMAAGHTDGQLFEWISNGIPNTAMPALGSRLSENDRWNVINYVRLFSLSR